MTNKLIHTAAALTLGLAGIGTLAGSASAGPLPGRYEIVADGAVKYFTVPAVVRSIRITAQGGSGSDGKSVEDTQDRGGYGGAGAQVVATVSVQPGEILRLVAGGNGLSYQAAAAERSGGTGGTAKLGGAGGGGGSASVVSLNGEELLVAAGGGGGGGGAYGVFDNARGGDGGAGNSGRGFSGWGNGHGAGGNGLLTVGTGGAGGTGADGGGGGGGGGGGRQGGVAGSGGTFGPGGGGGGAAGVSWAADPSATFGTVPTKGLGRIVIQWAPRPFVHIASSADPAAPGAPISFTVNVTPDIAGAPIATGTVWLSLLDNATGTFKPLASAAALAGGLHAFDLGPMMIGPNQILATYSGDNYYEGATGSYSQIVAADRALGVDRPSLPLGTVGLGRMATASIVVANTGNVATGVLTIVSANPQLTFRQRGCGTGALAYAGYCWLDLTFTPTAIGAFATTLTIHDPLAPANVSKVVNVSATVVAIPTVTPSVAVLDFGTVARGARLTKSITLTNKSTVLWTADTLAVAAGPFTAVTSTCRVTLAPGGSCSMSVTFAPLAAGSYAGAVSGNETTGQSSFGVRFTGIGS